MRSASFTVTVIEHDNGDTELQMDGGEGWAIPAFTTAFLAMADGAEAEGTVETKDGMVIPVHQ